MAENTIDGRNWVRTMLGEKAFLMQVGITTRVRLATCDARWLERIDEDVTDAEAIAGYWSGRALYDEPLWEYLLEGQIASTDSDELERLREFVRLKGPPKDLLSSENRAKR
jgi:hypothetical protein